MAGADQQQVPGDNVLLQSFRSSQALRAVLARTVVGTGITADEYAVLGVINLLGPISPTELSTRLSVPATTISRYLAGFETLTPPRGSIRRRTRSSRRLRSTAARS